MLMLMLSKLRLSEADSEGSHSTPLPLPPLSFLQSLFFFPNHFKVLKTVLFEVELIINDAALTYVYLNTIETCLTPNHLLFGRQL